MVATQVLVLPVVLVKRGVVRPVDVSHLGCLLHLATPVVSALLQAIPIVQVYWLGLLVFARLVHYEGVVHSFQGL